MADSAGVNRVTGEPLTDYYHVRQSIATILTTPIGSRVMRRDFGSELIELVDAAMNEVNVLRVYAATALAIAKWEPRFRVTGCSLDQADESGRLHLTISGQYLPRGHLGDFTPEQTGLVVVPL